MTMYVDPACSDTETWLRVNSLTDGLIVKNGSPDSMFDVGITHEATAVCLRQKNSKVTAAVGFSPDALGYMLSADTEFKLWYMIPNDVLKEVLPSEDFHEVERFISIAKGI